MIELGRTEEVIREMDKLANEDHTHHAPIDRGNLRNSDGANYSWNDSQKLI